MPRSLRRKSTIMDLSKLARRHNAHPYNLRPRNGCTNYHETRSQPRMTGSRRRRQISSKLLNPSTQNDTTNSRRLNLSPVETPCSSNSIEQSTTNTSDRIPPETTTIYVNEDFGKTTEASSDEVTEDEPDADDPEEERPSENTGEVEESPSNSSEDADMSDTSYRRNYSASAYDYQELIGHSNGFLFGRSASQSAAGTEIDLAENLRDFDALATGDGGHNDPNVLEFSVTVLDDNENFF